MDDVVAMSVNPDLDVFVGGDASLARALALLSAGESMTDDLAMELLSLLGRPPEWSTNLLAALHMCDFVVERNSEWHLAPRVRRTLLISLTQNQHLSEQAHALLLRLARESGSVVSVTEVPRYLTEGPGAAYHGAFLSRREALREYTAIAEAPLTGQQWLASHLASEQVDIGVLPGDAVELLFLQGIIKYRERKRREAEPILRRVANTAERSREVAIAAHLVGRIDAKQFARRKRGEMLLRRSLGILEELGDELGVAQVLHTLGQLVGRDRKRSDEAEALLRRSLEIEEGSGAEWGVAQVLHTLGQVVGRDGERCDEAEALLRRSLDIGKRLDKANHEAQVLYSMSQVAGVSTAQAESLLRQSLAVNRRIRNRSGERIVLAALQRLGFGRDG